MALINCPECRKEISDQSSNCPNCGIPIAPHNREDIVLLCPKCYSQQLEMITQSDGIGKTKCVVETVGPLAGTPDQDKVKVYCKKCGHISPYSKVIRARKMTNSIDEQLKQLIRDGAKLQAMKNYKELTGCDLGTAKCYIDSLSASDGDDKTYMINNYTPKPMYKICKYCGATSTTTDKCSNCGAPIEKFDEGPLATEYTKVRKAVERHYIEAERKGMFINKQSVKRIKTIIYIDNIKAFKIVSSSGNVGRYKVFAKHQDLIVAITNISKRKAVILPGRTHRFGNDMNELISTISEVLSAIDSQFDESRIKVETYEYNVLKYILPPILSSLLVFILGIITWGACYIEGLDQSPGSLIMLSPGLYILLSLINSEDTELKYKLERKVKVLAGACITMLVVIGLLCESHYDYDVVVNGYHQKYYLPIYIYYSILLCHSVVVAVYSYIMGFKVLNKSRYQCTPTLITPLILAVLSIYLLICAAIGLKGVFYEDLYWVTFSLLILEPIIMSIFLVPRKEIKD